MAPLQFGLGSNSILDKFNPFQNKNQNPYQRNFQSSPQLQLNPLNPPENPPPNPQDPSLTQQARGMLDNNFNSPLEQFRTVATPDRDKYRELLQNTPQRKDYQMSKLGKALAMTSGVADAVVSKDASRGIKTGQGIMDRPYDTAMNDYATKGGMLKELSGLEYQDIQDKKGLEQAIDKTKMEKRAAYAEGLKTISGLSFNAKQMENIDDEMKARGITTVKGDDGFLYAVNTKDQTVKPMAQMFKDMWMDQDWQKELLRIAHQNRLSEGAQDNAAAMARTQVGEAGADRRSAAQIKAATRVKVDDAYDTAIDIVSKQEPQLAASVVSIDPTTGKPTINTAGNPQAAGLFMQKVFQTTNTIMNEPTFPTDTSEYFRDTKGNVIGLRDYAIAAIKADQNDPNTPLARNEEAIAAAMEQIKAQRAKEDKQRTPSPTPSVAIPSNIGPRFNPARRDMAYPWMK